MKIIKHIIKINLFKIGYLKEIFKELTRMRTETFDFENIKKMKLISIRNNSDLD
jgi:hypothetical protein